MKKDNKNTNSKVFGGSSGAHTSTKPRKSHKARNWLIAVACVLILGVAGYLTAVYSQIPFIKNLREMYIQTAMSTFTHQWLATAFIPEDVVNDVMDRYYQELQNNLVEESRLPGQDEPAEPEPPEQPTTPEDPVTPEKPDVPDEPDVPEEPPEDPDPTGLLAMLELFPELDPETIPEDIEDFHELQIKDIVDMGIKTTVGDDVWAIDVPNKLIIVYYKNSDYTGKLAIIKDSTRVMLAVNHRQGRGTTVTDFCTQEGAVLGVNAGGFLDVEGHGKGDVVEGLVISDGEILSEAKGGTYQTCGFDYDGNLRMGYALDLSELRYAVEFEPIIVLNGELHVNRNFMSKQPRTCIGQTSDKTVLLLVVEGRGVTTGLGASVETCANILLKYDCYNAMNMDGGSSSSMSYMGEMITKASTPMAGGRTIPDAWVVLPPAEEEPEKIPAEGDLSFGDVD